MCRPASFVVTKGPKAFWSKKTDLHRDIRTEFGLPENGVGRVTSVQIEIVPDNSDFALPLEQWNFKVDQEELPDWWDAEVVERECRIELNKWAAAKLVRHGETRDIHDGDNIVAICGGKVSAIYGGTISEICGGTISEICGGTISAIYGGTVSAIYGGTVSAIYGGTVSAICGGTVSAIRGGTVSEIRGGTVCFYRNFSVRLRGLFTVIIDKTGDKAVCHVGEESERIVSGGNTKGE